MTSQLSNLSCVELSNLMKEKNVPSDVIKKIIDENIAGRHIADPYPWDDIREFGFRSGDILDLKKFKSSLSEQDFLKITPQALNDNVHQASKLQLSEPSEVLELHDQHVDFHRASEQLLNESFEELDEGGDLPSNMSICEGGGTLDESVSSSSSIEERNAEIAKYATKEMVSKMNEGDKRKAILKIKFYEYCQEKDLSTEYPVFETSGVRTSDKSSRKETRSSSSKSNRETNLPRASLSKSNRETRLPRASSSRQPEQNNSSEEEAPPSTSNEGKRKASGLKTYAHASNVPLLPEHKAFLESDRLTEEVKAEMKEILTSPSTFKYSILPILEGKKGLVQAVELLNSQGFIVDEKCLQKVQQALAAYLCSMVPHPKLVSPDMREGMAVSFVASYPKMSQKPVKKEDKPWSWMFDRSTNTGKLANVVRVRVDKTGEGPRGGGTGKRKTPVKKPEKENMIVSVDDLPLSKEAKYLKALMENDRVKDEIIEQLKVTHKERRLLIDQGLLNCRIMLEAFPHLRSFKGEMIDLEFSLLYPNLTKNFLKNFLDYVPKLVALAKTDTKKYPPRECFRYSDDTLNALIILAKFLPTPRRTYTYEDNMETVPLMEDFFHVLPVGSNVLHEINKKRTQSCHPIQPYILALGDTQIVRKMILVLGDSESVELPRATIPLKAVDLLFKAHFVLNFHYCLGWKHVYRFLEYHFYGIAPTSNKLTTFAEKFMALENL